jgi:23S rRNA (guanine745-N1)-methyltransferase
MTTAPGSQTASGILACSVRNCAQPLTYGEGQALTRGERHPLERHPRAWRCANGHTFDVARSGYVNLLQPGDRRSLSAGDSREAVDARARLLARGIGQHAIDAVTDWVASLEVDRQGVAVDLGSGSGEALAAIVQHTPVSGVGIDLSTAAADHAARRFPAITWIVANADRRLPLVDGRVSLVLSMHGRRNPAECVRVMTADARLIVALPAPDDLVELRAHVQGEGVERERAAALVASHAPHFTLLERREVRERHRLERDALRDLLRGTYRGARLRAAERVEQLETLEVTLASEMFLFARR